MFQSSSYLPRSLPGSHITVCPARETVTVTHTHTPAGHGILTYVTQHAGKKQDAARAVKLINSVLSVIYLLLLHRQIFLVSSDFLFSTPHPFHLPSDYNCLLACNLIVAPGVPFISIFILTD